MDASPHASPVCIEGMLRSGAKRLTGFQRRLFLAEVATELCDGSPRKAERRNRMNYRHKRIQKGKPLEKTNGTDAIFAIIEAVRHQVRDGGVQGTPYLTLDEGLWPG